MQEISQKKVKKALIHKSTLIQIDVVSCTDTAHDAGKGQTAWKRKQSETIAVLWFEKVKSLQIGSCSCLFIFSFFGIASKHSTSPTPPFKCY